MHFLHESSLGIGSGRRAQGGEWTGATEGEGTQAHAQSCTQAGSESAGTTETTETISTVEVPIKTILIIWMSRKMQ